MPGISMPAKSSDAVALEKIYLEIRAAIRVTDDISFKLLSLVPLVSGTALIGLLLQTRTLPAPLVMLLALFAGGITLGLFRWELRNTQTCSWLMTYADALEKHALTAEGMGELFQARPHPPQHVGKTEAEKSIYLTTVLAWLSLPWGIGVVPQLTDAARMVYGIVGSAIFVGTVVSLFAQSRVPPVVVMPSNKATGAQSPSIV